MSSETQPLLSNRYRVYNSGTVEYFSPVSFSKLQELVSQQGLRKILCTLESPDIFSGDTHDLCTTTPATSLKNLELRFCQTEYKLSGIEKFSNLESLSICNVVIDKEKAERIGKINHLKTLCLLRCIITDDATAELLKLPLNRFSTYTCITNTNKLISTFHSTTTCRHITLETDEKKIVSIQSIINIFIAHPNLEIFCCNQKLSGNSDELVSSLKSLANLQKLSLNVTGLPAEIDSKIREINTISQLVLDRHEDSTSFITKLFQRMTFAAV